MNKLIVGLFVAGAVLISAVASAEINVSYYSPFEYAYTQSGDGENRAYFKFDLSGLSSDSIGFFSVPAEGISYETSYALAYMTSGDWTAATVTWDTQPEFGEFIGNGTPFNSNYYWSLSSFDGMWEGGILSFGISSDTAFGNPQSVLLTTASASTAPEPVSTALFLLGGATLALKRLRKK